MHSLRSLQRKQPSRERRAHFFCSSLLLMICVSAFTAIYVFRANLFPSSLFENANVLFFRFQSNGTRHTAMKEGKKEDSIANLKDPSKGPVKASPDASEQIDVSKLTLTKEKKEKSNLRPTPPVSIVVTKAPVTRQTPPKPVDKNPGMVIPVDPQLQMLKNQLDQYYFMYSKGLLNPIQVHQMQLLQNQYQLRLQNYKQQLATYQYSLAGNTALQTKPFQSQYQYMQSQQSQPFQQSQYQQAYQQQLYQSQRIPQQAQQLQQSLSQQQYQQQQYQQQQSQQYQQQQYQQQQSQQYQPQQQQPQQSKQQPQQQQPQQPQPQQSQQSPSSKQIRNSYTEEVYYYPFQNYVSQYSKPYPSSPPPT